MAMADAQPRPPLIYNVGAGRGNSVRELANACQRATGVAFPVVEHARRQGDPPYIVGDARKIFAELGWRAQYTNLTESLEHMWHWRRKLANRDRSSRAGVGKGGGHSHGGGGGASGQSPAGSKAGSKARYRSHARR